MLTKEQILAPRALPRHEVTIEEWGGPVFVRTLSAAEFVAWQEQIRGLDAARVAASLIVATVEDAAGNRLFAPEDTEALMALPNSVIQRLFWTAERLNIVDKADAAKNVRTRSSA